MRKTEVKISTEYIKLDQLLKFSGISENGSTAKSMILDGIVSVNGEVCLMRGKKIRSGDIVSVNLDSETVEMTVI
ncbi:MAG: RNA-binding S4 domain-containing protein [Clostridia bacterium]|nr:RNA-binding S4 domain-containing protein [Clostridia bacterium]